VPGAQLIQLEGDCHFLGVARSQDESIANATLRFLDGDSAKAVVTPPAGTVPAGAFRAILFTDVVASTPLLAHLEDEKMRAVMRDHDEVL